MTRHFARVALALCAAAAGCHPTPRPPASAATPALSEIQASNTRRMNAVLASIAGRETEPASAVFRNVQLANLGRVPARQFLSIMNGGYSAALGVTCAHCHVDGDFASDSLRPKRAARQMAVMHTAINTQLRGMSELATQPPERRAINCSTCHRGAVNPMAPPR